MTAGRTADWTLILPCAAPEPPEPRQRPVWLLTTPTGQLVVRVAAASVPAAQIGRIIVTMLADTDRRYEAAAAVRRAFGPVPVECLVLDQATPGPAATVRDTIRALGITGPICVKDGDTLFDPPELPQAAFAAVADIRARRSLSRPGRKSYVRLNEQGMMTSILEKTIVSHWMSAGLYGFLDAADFCDEFDALVQTLGRRDMFLSHVMASAISGRLVALPVPVENLVDIETPADWHEYRQNLATIFIDLDGVLIRNQSEFFAPLWGEPVEPVVENVAHILALQRGGAQIVCVTARPEPWRAATEAALDSIGLRPHALIMGCRHATRYMVNDFAQSNPFPAAVALNIERNRGTLPNLLLPEAAGLEPGA